MSPEPSHRPYPSPGGVPKQAPKEALEVNRLMRMQALTRLVAAVAWGFGAVVATNAAGLAGFLANALVFLLLVSIGRSGR